MTQSIGIIGGGAWGTALAQVFAGGSNPVTLWAREADVVNAINTKHENIPFLPGVVLHKNLKATGDLNEIAKNDILLFVTPTQFLRATLELIKSALKGKSIVLCCKGVELNTGLLPSQIAKAALPDSKISVMTGPTFAAEIARGLPAAVTIAADKLADAKALQEALSEKNFRLYASDDIIGAEIGGALKNVIAIACGIVHGKKLGESARAAVISRGLIEMGRLCAAMGGKRETLMGLCGIGDLTLTASSMQSRNFSFGAALGEGKSADEILGSRKAVTEGVYTAKAALELAKKHNVDLPIVAAVNACANEGVAVDKAIETLLSRPVKEEI